MSIRPRLIHSIRWRLQAWYALLFSVLLLGFGLTAYHFEATAVADRVNDELSRLAVALSDEHRRPLPEKTSTELSPPSPPPPRDKKSRKSSRPSRPAGSVVPPGYYFAVWLHNGVPFTASPNAPADLPQPPARQLGAHTRTRGPYREAYFSADYGDIALVGRPFADEQARLDRFAWKLLLGGVGIFAVAVIFGWWLVTRALRPIHDISTAATKIAIGDLSQRINTRETDSELDRLADVLNSTFSRLEAAFARQQRFTADAAHELRTPVTVIVTHVQNSLATPGLTEEHREALEACERAAQRMRRLIESLLHLARLDAGEDAAKPERIDLAALTADAVASIRTVAAERKITLVTELVATEIIGDPGRLQQVITNLLANAIYHGREGGEVRIGVHAETDHAVLVVADNGPGIPAAHLPHLFERFYRVDKARTGAAGRTGLGLAIAKAIVDAHSGTIKIASIVDEGTTATVRLPRG